MFGHVGQFRSSRANQSFLLHLPSMPATAHTKTLAAMPKKMRQLITILTITLLGLNNVFGCVCNDLDYKKMLKTYDYVVIGRPTTNIHPDSTAVRLLNNEGKGSEVFFTIEKVI